MKINDKSLDNFEFMKDIRIGNCFRRYGIKMLNDLYEIKRHGYGINSCHYLFNGIKIENFGRKSAYRIMEELHEKIGTGSISNW